MLLESFVRYEHAGNRQAHEHWYCNMLDRVVPSIKKIDAELVQLSMGVMTLLRAVQVERTNASLLICVLFAAPHKCDIAIGTHEHNHRTTIYSRTVAH